MVLEQLSLLGYGLQRRQLQTAEAAHQVPDCRKCLGPLSDARRDGLLPCRRSAIKCKTDKKR